MTTTEKNKRIEEVEKKMEKLRKDLSEIRETPTTDYSFEKWYKFARTRAKNVIEWKAPDWHIDFDIGEHFKLYYKQLVFSYCYDNNWFIETREHEEYPRTNPGYYIVYNEMNKTYEETGTNPCYSNPLTVYFSSSEIAKKCADWLNDGGYIDKEFDEL